MTGRRLLVVVLLVFVAGRARATPLAGAAGTALGVPFRIPTIESIQLKACFSTIERATDSTDATGLNCQGQTWNGARWLAQTDPWSDHPKTTTRDGFAQGVVAVRSDSVLPPYFYLLWLPEGTTSAGRKKTVGRFETNTQGDNRHVRVQAFSASGQLAANGWITTEPTALWAPVIDGEAAVDLSESTARFSYRVAATDPPAFATTFRFDTAGTYHVSLNRPAPRLFWPTLDGPQTVRPGAAATFRLTPDTGHESVEWLVDGQRQEGIANDLTLGWPTASQHRVTARLVSGESASRTVSVVSYPSVRFAQALPRPATGDEILKLVNGGGENVSLAGWAIVDRSTRRLTLSDTLAAGATKTITTHHFLANGGGDYDLLNESGERVDRLSYPAVAVNDRIGREPKSVIWRIEPAVPMTKPVTIEGTLAGRGQKRLTLKTANGQIVRINFGDQSHPVVARGDIIRLTNVTLAPAGAVFRAWTTAQTVFSIISRAKKVPPPRLQPPAPLAFAPRAVASGGASPRAPSTRSPPVETTLAALPAATARSLGLVGVAAIFAVAAALLSRPSQC